MKFAQLVPWVDCKKGPFRQVSRMRFKFNVTDVVSLQSVFLMFLLYVWRSEIHFSSIPIPVVEVVLSVLVGKI